MQRFAGEAFEFLDIVTDVAGLRSFDEEYKKAPLIRIGTLQVKVLSLERIIQSKKTLGRPKDRAVLPALEATLKAIHKKT